MENRIYNEQNGLWYEKQGDYYIPCLTLPEKENQSILTENHPFLRKVLRFMENRREWQGAATELLAEIGDSYTPPNTVTKLLHRFDYEYFYKRDIVIQFRRTNRKRIIRLTNYGYRK